MVKERFEVRLRSLSSEMTLFLPGCLNVLLYFQHPPVLTGYFSLMAGGEMSDLDLFASFSQGTLSYL